MTPSLIRPRELRFVTEQLWPLSSLLAYPRFAGHSLETFESVLDLSRKLAQEKFAPHNRASDANEPHVHEGRVRIIPEVKLALDAYADAATEDQVADNARGGSALRPVVGDLRHRGLVARHRDFGDEAFLAGPADLAGRRRAAFSRRQLHLGA